MSRVHELSHSFSFSLPMRESMRRSAERQLSMILNVEEFQRETIQPMSAVEPRRQRAPHQRKRMRDGRDEDDDDDHATPVAPLPPPSSAQAIAVPASFIAKHCSRALTFPRREVNARAVVVAFHRVECGGRLYLDQLPPRRQGRCRGRVARESHSIGVAFRFTSARGSVEWRSGGASVLRASGRRHLLACDAVRRRHPCWQRALLRRALGDESNRRGMRRAAAVARGAHQRWKRHRRKYHPTLLADESGVAVVSSSAATRSSEKSVERAWASSTRQLSDVGASGCLFGVQLLWVDPTWRRTGLASDLVDAARHHAVYGYAVPREHCAFAAPTSDGMRFARRFTSRPDFLTFA